MNFALIEFYTVILNIFLFSVHKSIVKEVNQKIPFWFNAQETLIDWLDFCNEKLDQVIYAEPKIKPEAEEYFEFWTK